MGLQRSGAVSPGLIRLNPETMDRTDLLLKLQQGVLLELPDAGAGDGNGISVTGFLLKVLRVEKHQFLDEVRTLMLNSRVVDDPDTTRLRGNDILIVSGAMPGLVGAMLRSNSPIKALRATITGDNAGRETPEDGSESNFIRFKAFNTVLRDHFKDIMDYGAYDEPADV